jgi:hypothetical protein
VLVFKANVEIVETTTHCVRLVINWQQTLRPPQPIAARSMQTGRKHCPGTEAERVCSCHIQPGLQLQNVLSDE